MAHPCGLGFLTMWWLNSKNKCSERERGKKREERGERKERRGEKEKEGDGGKEGEGEREKEREREKDRTHPGRNHISFYDLALEVAQCYSCHILLV